MIEKLKTTGEKEMNKDLMSEKRRKLKKQCITFSFPKEKTANLEYYIQQ